MDDAVHRRAMNPSQELQEPVPQGNMILSGSIKENIAFYRPIDDEKIAYAAKMAEIYDFIKEQPEGFDTILGEKGLGLSEGQVQRLAIARAIYFDAPLFILDEATSALDSESEFFIKKAIETIAENKTVIAIAHRISTIQHADCIFIFEQGNLIGQGTHNRLLAENKLYQQLVAKQLLST